MAVASITNYYYGDKITRRVGHGIRQDWYGVHRGKGRLVCAQCGGLHKAKKLFAIYESDRRIIVWQCGCGNFKTSITYKSSGEPVKLTPTQISQLVD